MNSTNVKTYRERSPNFQLGQTHRIWSILSTFFCLFILFYQTLLHRCYQPIRGQLQKKAVIFLGHLNEGSVFLLCFPENLKIWLSAIMPRGWWFVKNNSCLYSAVWSAPSLTSGFILKQFQRTHFWSTQNCVKLTSGVQMVKNKNQIHSGHNLEAKICRPNT